MDQPQTGQPDPVVEVAELHAAPRPAVDVDLQVPAAAAQVGDIRRAIRTAASAHGIAEPLLGDISLALTEACANVVTHAYDDSLRPGSSSVEAYRENHDFVVTMSDTGSGMVPSADSAGLGLGLALIARLTRRMEIMDSHPAGCTVLMAFAISQA